MNPQALRQQLDRMLAEMQDDRLDAAWARGESLRGAGVDVPDLWHLRSEIAYARADYAAALEALERLARLLPASWGLTCKRVELLLARRDRIGAAAALRAGMPLAEGEGQALWQFGKLFNKCGLLEDARDAMHKALSRLPNSRELLYDIATTEFFLGDFDAAERHVEALLDRQSGDALAGHALYLRSTLRRQTPERNHLADLEQRLHETMVDAKARGPALYALAKEQEDLGLDTSFATLAEGARWVRSTLRPALASEIETMGLLAQHFDEAWMHATPAGDGGEGVVFIVGLPRTGTTLVEHLLSREVDIVAAGELLDFPELLHDAARRRVATSGASLLQAAKGIDFAALGRAYEASARGAAGGAGSFIDKLPVNFQYCGLIHKALPKAKIIHLVRHPVASAYAIYKTLFGQAYPFSYDLEELADYFIAYHGLIRHWHGLMPGVIRDVHYEDVVADPRKEIDALVAWLEIRSHAARPGISKHGVVATASSAQVREPVHLRSVDAWRKYEDALMPFRRKLQAAGIPT